MKDSCTKDQKKDANKIIIDNCDHKILPKLNITTVTELPETAALLAKDKQESDKARKRKTTKNKKRKTYTKRNKVIPYKQFHVKYQVKSSAFPSGKNNMIQDDSPIKNPPLQCSPSSPLPLLGNPTSLQHLLL